MANMAHCRFENTLNDLTDCEDNLDEMLNHGDMDSIEYQKAHSLLKMCNRIAANYYEDYGD